MDENNVSQDSQGRNLNIEGAVNTPPPIEPKKDKSKILIPVIVVVILAAIYISLAAVFQLWPMVKTPVVLNTPTPTASPTQDATSNWKTYTSQANFEFKYPPVYTLDGGTQCAGLRKNGSDDKNLAINICFFENPNKLSAKQYITQTYGKGQIVSQLTDVSVSVYPAVSWVEGGIVDYPHIFLSHDSVIISFSISENSQVKSDFDQILSTFKFTK